MKAIDATDHIARLLKKVLDEDRHTGEINIKVICNQGGIRSMKIDVVDTRVSSFEFQGAEGRFTSANTQSKPCAHRSWCDLPVGEHCTKGNSICYHNVLKRNAEKKVLDTAPAT